MTYIVNTQSKEIVEKWKPISGFEQYEISNFGNIVSLKFSGALYPNRKQLKPYKTGKGYLTVRLICNGKNKNFKIHRLVAAMFIPNPYKKPEVNHKDGKKENNHVNNLEWATTMENIHHSVKLNLNIKGEHHPFAKLKDGDIAQILEMDKQGVTDKKIAEIFFVSSSTISSIVNNRVWKHLANKQ